MKRGLFRWINLWPPLLGAGIRVVHSSEDLRSIEVEMKLTRLNRNYVGTHFGGSLFAMTDPFYMIMLKHALGPGFVVWDKAGSIRFRRPGISTVRAHFQLTEEQIAEARAALERDGIYEPRLSVDVVDPEGEVVCVVERLLYCATKQVHEARVSARSLRESGESTNMQQRRRP